MNWAPSENEIDAVLALEASKRYEYCIKKVADQEQLWSLGGNDGWSLAGDDFGHQLIPIWPHLRYAALCAQGPWANYYPKAIPLDVWLDRWIEGMERDRRFVAVFPTPKDKGISVKPRQIEQDLRTEMTNYE